MSYAELRSAAALMRKRAEWANEGPWMAQRHAWNEAWEVKAVDIGRLGCDFTRSDAEHIASWHPAVALAVADWLDAEADAHSGPIFDRWDNADHCCRMEPAHSVARAYLVAAPQLAEAAEEIDRQWGDL